MKRRNFVASVLASGVVAAPILMADHEHDKDEVSGPQANATVTFGAWLTDYQPPLNRFNGGQEPVDSNHHHMVPFEAQIKAGGTVNFVISGFHILGIYAPGTDVDDISTAVRINIPNAPAGFPQVINDPLNRVYWGKNPWALAPPPLLDRTESVTFSQPGTYLVICTFVPHFVPGQMHGYVKVLK